MSKTNSDLDINRLMQSLRNSRHSSQEKQWLREQLGSRALQEKLWALGVAVFPERLCDVCREDLAHYVHLEMMDEDADSQYPWIKHHLDLCSQCANEHQELVRIVSSEYADQIPAVPSYPAFDLSFLSQARDTVVTDWDHLWQEVTLAGSTVCRLATEIALSLVTPFSQLSAALRPALATVAVPMQRDYDGAAGEAKTIEVLGLQYPPANLLIRIGRGPVADQKTVLVIDVLHIEPPGPVPSARVTLYDEQHRLLERRGTDAAGNLQFENVQAGDYVIQILCAAGRWELPLSVTE